MTKCNFFFFFSCTTCSLLWTLASNTVFLHFFRSLATVCNLFFSLSSDSIQHHQTILSMFFLSSFFPCSLFFCLFPSFIISVCPYHLYLSDFINFTVPVLYNIYYVSLFVLIFQLYYSFSRLIFLTTYLSNSIRAMKYNSSLIQSRILKHIIPSNVFIILSINTIKEIIKIQFLPRSKHVTSLLLKPTSL